MNREETAHAAVIECVDAVGSGYTLPILADLQTALVFIANLQVACRHPRNPTADKVRQFIRTVIDRLRDDGYTATADLMEMGNDPAMDLPGDKDWEL